MLRKTQASLKARIWAAHLPKLVAKNERGGDPYDYYAVYFADVERNRYQLTGFNGSDVSMRCLNQLGPLPIAILLSCRPPGRNGE